MTEEKKALVEETIKLIAEDDIPNFIPCKIYAGETWIDEWIDGWIAFYDDEELADAWDEYNDEYGSGKAYEYYCNVLEMEGAISDWEWDYANQKITIKRMED